MKSLINLAAITVFTLAGPASAAPPENIDARIEELRKVSETPGLAVAIVENGEVTLAKGFGVRRLGSGKPVDADTLFMIGSTGKAFTAAALATLVDTGKIGWDDKVIDHLPGFQMHDAWVTREMTVRDLLVHRSGLGLGAGDLLIVPRGSISRQEIVDRLRYIEPATSFRSAYAYDNILYTVAGRLIEVVSGQSWEDYMRDHVFKPAGMTNATADKDRQLSAPDRAHPHGRVGGPVRGTGPIELLDETDRLGQAGAPAGLIALSANDFGRWLQIQLGHGAIPGDGRLFSADSSEQMWTPVTPMPITPWPGVLAETAPQFSGYALGWSVEDYKGHKIIWHAGGLFGFTSVVVLVPEVNVGFSITLNSEEIEPRYGLMYELLDHYLGLPKRDWATPFGKLRRERIAEAEKVVSEAVGSPAEVGPSLALDRYAGTYRDPWYGEMAVTKSGDGLMANFKTTPNMQGPLEHYQYDTFIVRFTDPSIEPAYLTFSLDAEGKVDRITAKPVSPIADFSFDYQDLLFTPAGD